MSKLYLTQKGIFQISKAQIEVWEMKDKIYNSVKHLTLKNALNQIKERSQVLTEQFIKDRVISVN